MTRKERSINIALWLAQASLASTLLFSGLIKLTQPSVNIASLWRWAEDYPNGVWMVGSVEIMLGIGILIPELLRIAMRITAWAAFACIGWTIGYSIFIASQGDWPTAGSQLPYLVLAAFIAWGRSKPQYTTPK
ncbi:DoxX family protein [Sphingobacterium sp. lm-10]|uniref:DoxX family protein n=1 Tax=Sphingobacterium sp. lm-10 TaxID=2944904 RepID=UPI00202197B8|nr:DoxX family protein [Sphingobacterium sp. lm-10]MCL7987472.1 DoxX family protein [Sphingobacterium sp. lm-10]